ncbi:MAG: tRNA (N6-isopentenyl adenosine(37)-C2)-methylthiotransferase MiaB [Treponema sp.]|nr:tRNA (N6-isopentenyl adenosine(37)-C2)-methylthiotransferase MiaB [Treponema sp.]
MTFFFETYGCQMNTADSAALREILRKRGWSAAEKGEDADLVLLNTCSVRETAEKRVLGRLAQYAALKKKRESRGGAFTLVVAGCMAQRLGEKLREDYRAVDYVMGTGARSVFPQILEAAEKGYCGRDTPLDPVNVEPAFAFSPFHLDAGQFRSFVPIMHGCNNFCSYCIVPYVRGREISRSPVSILEEIRRLAENGVREICLLGQNVNTYLWREDADPPCVSGNVLDFPGLLELVARALEKTGIRWVRFLSANPGDFSPEVIRVMAENPVFCRHLHLCVQHGSNAVLEAMNRKYTRESYIGLVKEIRGAMPGISLSTDILVGFPGETEEDLRLTLELMEEVKFLYAYMYHYNPREGTGAYTLPGRIPEPLKRERLGRVIALQKKHTAELLKSRLGARERVLVEGISRKNADELITRTEKDEMAVVPGPVSLIGSFAGLELSALRGNTFRAKNLVPSERINSVCP